jgi:hypothetical protein
MSYYVVNVSDVIIDARICFFTFLDNTRYAEWENISGKKVKIEVQTGQKIFIGKNRSFVEFQMYQSRRK